MKNGIRRYREEVYKVEADVQAPPEIGKSRLKGSRGQEVSVRGKQMEWGPTQESDLCLSVLKVTPASQVL